MNVPGIAFGALPNYVYNEIKNNAEDVAIGVVEKSDYLEYREYTCYMVLVIGSVEKSLHKDKAGEAQTLTYNCAKEPEANLGGIIWYDLIIPGTKIKVYKNNSEIVNGGIEFVEKVGNTAADEVKQDEDLGPLIVVISVIIVLSFAYYYKREGSKA